MNIDYMKLIACHNCMHFKIIKCMKSGDIVKNDYLCNFWRMK